MPLSPRLLAGLAATVICGVAAPSAAARMPNDPGFPRQYGLHNTGQSIGGTTGVADADIDAPEAWDVTTGSAAVRVAVVDDGVDYGQSDLAPNLIAGYDFGNADSDPTETASNHGSQTAAIIASRGDNALGIAGVNWFVGLMPLKVRTDGAGERFDMMAPNAIADAFRYAGTHGARVVNASFGLRSSTTSTERANVLAAIRESPNTLFVVSAGNSARDNDAYPRYPCSFDVVNLICVAASDQNDALWSQSNYGAKSVDLAAPGAKVYTLTGRNLYGYVNGTSYAAPFVSGVAALYLARYPQATTLDVRNALLGGVDAKPAFAGKLASGGRLNAAKTLAIPPAPVNTTVAQDSFSRTVTGGWGSAPTGGQWTAIAGGTAPLSVNGSQALVATPTGTIERHVGLTGSTPVRDLDAKVELTFPNSAGTSGAYFGAITIRRQSTDGSYIRVGLYAQGSSLLIRGQNSAGTTLWSNMNTGLGFVAGTPYALRVHAHGANPTTIRARAWKVGTSEPSTWSVNTTTTLGPQVAGTVGVRAVNTTTTATTLRFDNYVVAKLPTP